MRLYFPVDLTGNVNMIEKLVLGGTGTGTSRSSAWHANLYAIKSRYKSQLRHCGEFESHYKASLLIQNASKLLAVGAPPQTPLGELTAFPPILRLRWGECIKFVSLLSCWGCLAVSQTLLGGNNIILLAIIINCKIFE